MSIYYNSVQPLNIKTTGYSSNDMVDFNIRTRPGRAIKQGSIRFTGRLSVYVQNALGVKRGVLYSDGVFLDPYVGAHSLIRNISTQVSGSTIENIQYYPRIVGMKNQSKYTLEQLDTNTTCMTELLGTQNNVMLLAENGGTLDGTGVPNPLLTQGISFSFIPDICVNNGSDDLGNTKFGALRVMMNLANGVEAFYTTHTPTDFYMTTDGTTASALQFTNIGFTISGLECHWLEVIDKTTPAPVTFMSTSLITQALVTSNSFFNVTTAGTPYDAVALSFVQQSHRNSIYFNNNQCEFVPGIDGNGGRVEFSVNGNDRPIAFPILSYQELSLNYWKALGGVMKNSIMNALQYRQYTFGVGCAFSTSVNDRLGVALQLDPNDPAFTSAPLAANPYDAYIYVLGFVSV
jgi:hypothetical protein